MNPNKTDLRLACGVLVLKLDNCRRRSRMRKMISALGLSSALIFTLAVHAAAPANFAGTWTLDKSKSQGLNPRMQGADSVTWTIAQTDKTITVEEKVTGGQM